MLAISCLAISYLSNLTWFMDLTFQAPMQYCSLQHQTLPSPPDSSKTGCYFWFGSASLFLLELFLHCFPVAYWTPTNLGDLSFSVIFFIFPFHTVNGLLGAKILKWFTISFSYGPSFVRTVHHDPSILDNFAWHGSYPGTYNKGEKNSWSKGTEIIQSTLWSLWNYIKNQYQKIFENNPNIFKFNMIFTKLDLWLSHWTPQDG